MNKKRSIGRIKKFVLGAVIVATLGTALYIMANGLGLVDGLDFGAGAYYYADIPEFAKYVNGEHYASPYPMWLYIGLFLIWGAIMYKAWGWLDRKLKKK